MEIIVISNSTPNKSKPYAGKHVVRHLAIHQEMGYSVRTISPQESRQNVFRIVWKYLRVALQVLRAIFFYKIDVVHAHWVLPSGFFGAILSLVRRKPLVVTSHGAYTDVIDKHNALVRMLVNWVLSRADCIIAVGTEQQKRIEAMTRLPAGSIRCINMGVLIPTDIPSQEDARSTLKLEPDAQIVVFIGNMLRRKGPDLLIRALAEMSTANTVKTYVGGQGAYEPQIEQLIKDLDLGDQVTMIGPVQPDLVYTWFAAADVCVVPSRTEPFGLVAAEAMACGTPVIASAVGGLKESIQPEYNGLLFPNEDHHALAACLERLLADSELHARLSQNAPGSIARYDMRLQAEQVAAVYEEVFNARKQH